jgi:hypothetical protein
MIIFERHIEKDGAGEDVMVRLETDAEVGAQYIIPQQIQVMEGLSVGSPYVKIDFVDGDGDLSNIKKLNTNVVYTLSYGNEVHGLRVMRMYPVKTTYATGNLGKSENVKFTVHFIHESYRKMIHQTRDRAWSNSRYHDVVKQLATECDLSILGITPTKHQIDFIVQPYWSNLRLLKEIADKATPQDTAKSGHFEFGLSLEGEFFFLCMSDLMDKVHERTANRPASENRDGIPILKLQGSPFPDEERRRMLEENGFVPQVFYSYAIDEAYLDSITQGAAGTTDMFYDFKTAKYQKVKTTLSESDIAMLSEWSNIHKDDELSPVRNYRGRNIYAPEEGRNRVSSLVNTTQRMNISFDSTPFIKAGDIVEVVIPTPSEGSDAPFNEIHSGFYVVAEVKTDIKMYRKTGSLTTISLARQGNDDKEMEGYATSVKGKVSV